MCSEFVSSGTEGYRGSIVAFRVPLAPWFPFEPSAARPGCTPPQYFSILLSKLYTLYSILHFPFAFTWITSPCSAHGWAFTSTLSPRVARCPFAVLRCTGVYASSRRPRADVQTTQTGSARRDRRRENSFLLPNPLAPPPSPPPPSPPHQPTCLSRRLLLPLIYSIYTIYISFYTFSRFISAFAFRWYQSINHESSTRQFTPKNNPLF